MKKLGRGHSPRPSFFAPISGPFVMVGLVPAIHQHDLIRSDATASGNDDM